MGNHNKLRAGRISLDILCQTLNVDLVQRRFDLVENTEGGGVGLQDRKEQRNADKGLLTTRQLHQILDDLSRRRRLDLNAALQNVVGVGQRQLCTTAAEQFGEDATKVLVDLIEALDKGGLHISLQRFNDAGQLLATLFQIRDLLAHRVVLFLDFLVLFHGVQIDVTHTAQAVTALGLHGNDTHTRLGCDGRIAQCQCIRTGQLVILPQFTRQFILLGTKLSQLIFVLGVGTANACLFVHLLAHLAVEVVELFLKGKAVLFHQLAAGVEPLQTSLPLRINLAVGSHCLGQLVDLLLIFGHTLTQRFQLCAEGVDALLGRANEHMLRLGVLFVGADANVQLGQALFDLVYAILQVISLLVHRGTRCADLVHSGAQLSLLGVQGRQLFLVTSVSLGDLLILQTQLFHQRAVGVTLCQHLLKARRFACAKDSRQALLVVQLVDVDLALLDVLLQSANGRFQLSDVPLDLGQFALHTLDLAGAAENAALLLDRTARERTAHVDLLAVQRDHADTVARGLSHRRCVIDGIKNNRASEKRRQNVCKFSIGVDELIRHVHVAGIACRRLHFTRLARRSHRGQGEEGRTSCLAPLEGVHSGLGRALIVNDDVLQIGSQRRLDGRDIAIIDRDQLRQGAIYGAAGGAVSIGDLALGVLLHHEANAVGVTLKMLLHGTVGVDALGQRLGAQIGIVELSRLTRCLLALLGKRCLQRVRLLLQGSKACVVIGDGRAQLGALLIQLRRNADVVVKLRAHTVVFTVVGLACVFNDGQTDSNVRCLSIQRQNILLRCREVGLQHLNALAQFLLFSQESRLLLGQKLCGIAQLGDVAVVLGAAVDLDLHRTVGALNAALGRRDQFLGMTHAALLDAVVAVKGVVFFGQAADLGEQLLAGLLVALRLLEQTVVLLLHRGNRFLCSLKVEGRVIDVLLRDVQLTAQALRIVQPKADVCPLFVFQQFDRANRSGRFLGQGLYLCLDHAENIADTGHIVFGLSQLSLRLVFLVAVLGNTRSILKNGATLLALTRDHLGNTALTDDGITVTADTGIHKQLVNIAQTASTAIDKILTLARTVVAAGDRDLVVGAIQALLVVAVVQGDGNLRIAHRLTAVCTAKDNVLHLGASQRLRRNFAQDPTHRVRNIRLTASVRSYDDRNACGVSALAGALSGRIDQSPLGIKDKLCLIGKGLKALHFQ